MNKIKPVILISLLLLGLTLPLSADWNFEVIDPNANGGYVTQVLDSQGNPHLAYYDSDNSDVKYAYWDGTAWQIEVVDSAGDIGLYMDFTLDSEDHAHISYYDDLGEYDGNLKYAHWNGSSWDIETVDTGTDTGTDTSIDIDSNGYPHIAYVDNYNAILKYAKWDGTTWQLEVVDNGDHVGFYNDLVLDEDDHAHICYRDNAIGFLRYAEWDGTAWQLEILDDDSDERVGAFASIALDSQGYTHVSYYDWPDKLKYASWNGTSWDIEHVGLGGRGTSLVLDENDIPHISHSENSTTTTKYSTWDGIAWLTETIDGSSGVVGFATSLVLDEYSFPYIAYQDLGNGALKYASLVGNMPPSNFGLISPTDGFQLTSTTIDFQWESSNDPEMEDLEYSMNIFNSESDTLISLISDTIFTFDGSEFILDNAEYNWTVNVTDGEFVVASVDTFSFTGLEVGIDNLTNISDKGYVLNQNYPNPFNNQTKIKISFSNENLSLASKKLLIHNSKGEEVYSKDFSSFVDQNSSQVITFNASFLNSGTYYYSLYVDNNLIETKAMLFVK